MLKTTLRWLTIGGIFSIPIIIPFIVSASMFFPYITGKNFTFRIIVEIVFSAWLILAFLDAHYRPRFSWVLSALVLFVAVVGLADLFGANPFKSFWSNFERMEGYVAILHLFAYFLVAGTVLNSDKLWRAFWYSTLGTSVLVAFVGLAPFFDTLSITALPRLEARFGNPIYLAVYSLFHIFIALILMARWRGKAWHQWLMGAVALLHIITMVLTQTRGTVLGFLGGAVLTTALTVLLERERTILRWVAGGALLVVMTVVGAGYVVKDTEWAQTTPLISRFTQISLSSGTVNARFMNWGMAWEGVKESPLLGYGQDNYEYVFSKHYNPSMYGEEPWFDRTHNLVFDWLIAAGFLGLIAYLLIPLSLLTHLWVIDPHERHWSWRSLVSFTAIRTLIARRDDAFPATERALWTGLLAAYIFHNLFVFDNIVSYILFFSVLAYLHWRVTEGHEPLLHTVEVSRDTVTSVVLPVTLVATAVVFWYLNVPGITTSQTLINAIMQQKQLPTGQVVQKTPEDTLEDFKKVLEIDQLGRQEVREQFTQMAAGMQRAEGVSEETREAYRTLAITEMERELERNADSARLWLFMGSLYLQIGQTEKSEQAFEKAVELTPTKQVALFQLGELKLMTGKAPEALELFKKAYELQPEYDEARMLYALLLIRSGSDKEAVDLLTERFGTAAIDDQRLFLEWSNAKRFDIASEILEKRLEANPEDIQSKVSLAAAYKELGRINEAVELLREIGEKNPQYLQQMNQFITEVRGY
jgi:cytochrome c-type biogenesis protein CcmH/NrfG/O-antigen ligase